MPLLSFSRVSLASPFRLHYKLLRVANNPKVLLARVIPLILEEGGQGTGIQ